MPITWIDKPDLWKMEQMQLLKTRTQTISGIVIERTQSVTGCSVMPVSNPPEMGKQYEAIKAPEPGNSTLEVEASHLIVCKNTMPSSKDGEERYVTIPRLSDSQLQLEVYR